MATKTAADRITALQQERAGLLAAQVAAKRTKDPEALRKANAALKEWTENLRLNEEIAEQERADAEVEALRQALERRKSLRADARSHFANKTKIGAELDALVVAVAEKWRQHEAADVAARRASEQAMGCTMQSAQSSWPVMDAIINKLCLAGVPIARGILDHNAPTVAQASEKTSIQALGELNRSTRDLD